MSVLRHKFLLVALLQAWIGITLVSSQQRCLGGFDIYFILDKSGSVHKSFFQRQTVDFVQKTVGNFVGKGVRLSFIAFSSDGITETILRLTSDRSKIKEGLDELRKVQPGGDTYLGKALRMANSQVASQLEFLDFFSLISDPSEAPSLMMISIMDSACNCQYPFKLCIMLWWCMLSFWWKNG